MADKKSSGHECSVCHKCAHCSSLNANIRCCKQDCDKYYHLPCAALAGCTVDVAATHLKEGGLFCPRHVSAAGRDAKAAEHRSPEAWVKALLELKREVAASSDDALLSAVFNPDLDKQGLGPNKGQTEVDRELALTGVDVGQVIARQDKIIDRAFEAAVAAGHRCDVCNVTFRKEAVVMPLPAIPAHLHGCPPSHPEGQADPLCLSSPLMPYEAALLLETTLPALAIRTNMPGADLHPPEDSLLPSSRTRAGGSTGAGGGGTSSYRRRGSDDFVYDMGDYDWEDGGAQDADDVETVVEGESSKRGGGREGGDRPGETSTTEYSKRTWHPAYQPHDGLTWMGSAPLRCADCGIRVHAGCYGVSTKVAETYLRSIDAEGDLIWRCEWCAVAAAKSKESAAVSAAGAAEGAGMEVSADSRAADPPCCLLCPVEGATSTSPSHGLRRCTLTLALTGDESRQASCKTWVHASCALWCGAMKSTVGCSIVASIGDLRRLGNINVRVEGSSSCSSSTAGDAVRTAVGTLQTAIDAAAGDVPSSILRAILSPLTQSARVCAVCTSREGLVLPPCTDPYHTAVAVVGASGHSTAHPSAHAPCAIEKQWHTEPWAPHPAPHRLVASSSSMAKVPTGPSPAPAVPLSPPSCSLLGSGGMALYDPTHQPVPYFCVCREPFDRFMLECEVCSGWHHADCMGVSEGSMGEGDTFACAACRVLDRQGTKPSEALIELNKKHGANEFDLAPRPVYARLLVLPALLPTGFDWDQKRKEQEAMAALEYEMDALSVSSASGSAVQLDPRISGGDIGDDTGGYITPALLFATRAWAEKGDKALAALRAAVASKDRAGTGAVAVAKSSARPGHGLTVTDLGRVRAFYSNLHVPFAISDRTRVHMLHTQGVKEVLSRSYALARDSLARCTQSPASVDACLPLTSARVEHLRHVLHACESELEALLSALPPGMTIAHIESVLLCAACWLACLQDVVLSLEQHSIAVSTAIYSGQELPDAAAHEDILQLAEACSTQASTFPATLPAAMIERVNGAQALLRWSVQLATTLQTRHSKQLQRANAEDSSKKATAALEDEEEQLDADEMDDDSGGTSGRSMGEGPARKGATAVSTLPEPAQAVDIAVLAVLLQESTLEPLRSTLCDMFLRYSTCSASSSGGAGAAPTPAELGRGKRTKAVKGGAAGKGAEAKSSLLPRLGFDAGRAPVGWSVFSLPPSARSALARDIIGRPSLIASLVPALPAPIAKTHPLAVMAEAVTLGYSAIPLLQRTRSALPRDVLEACVTSSYGGVLPGTPYTEASFLASVGTRRIGAMPSLNRLGDIARLRSLVTLAGRVDMLCAELTAAATLLDKAADWDARAAELLEAAQRVLSSTSTTSSEDSERPALSSYVLSLESLLHEAPSIPVYLHKLEDVKDAKDALSWRDRADACLLALDASSQAAPGSPARLARPALSLVESLVKGASKAGVDQDQPILKRLIAAVQETNVALQSMRDKVLLDGSKSKADAESGSMQAALASTAAFANCTGGVAAHLPWEDAHAVSQAKEALVKAVAAVQSAIAQRTSELQRQVSVLSVLPLQSAEEEGLGREARQLHLASTWLTSLSALAQGNAATTSLTAALASFLPLDAFPSHLQTLLLGLLSSKQCKDIVLKRQQAQATVQRERGAHSHGREGTEEADLLTTEEGDEEGKSRDSDIDSVDENDADGATGSGSDRTLSFALTEAPTAAGAPPVSAAKLMAATSSHKQDGASTLGRAAALLYARALRLCFDLDGKISDLHSAAGEAGSLHKGQHALMTGLVTDANTLNTVVQLLGTVSGVSSASLSTLQSASASFLPLHSELRAWLRQQLEGVLVQAKAELTRSSSMAAARDEATACFSVARACLTAGLWPVDILSLVRARLQLYLGACRLQHNCEAAVQLLMGPSLSITELQGSQPVLQQLAQQREVVRLSAVACVATHDSGASYTGGIGTLSSQAIHKADAIAAFARAMTVQASVRPAISSALTSPGMVEALIREPSTPSALLQGTREVHVGKGDDAAAATEAVAQELYTAAASAMDAALSSFTPEEGHQRSFLQQAIQGLGASLRSLQATNSAAEEWTRAALACTDATDADELAVSGQHLLQEFETSGHSVLPKSVPGLALTLVALSVGAAARRLTAVLKGEAQATGEKLRMSVLTAVHDCCAELLARKDVSPQLPPVFAAGTQGLTAALTAATQWKYHAEVLISGHVPPGTDAVATAETLLSGSVIQAVHFEEVHVLQQGVACAKDWASRVQQAAETLESAVKEAVKHNMPAKGSTSGVQQMSAAEYGRCVDGRLRNAAADVALLLLQASQFVSSKATETSKAAKLTEPSIPSTSSTADSADLVSRALHLHAASVQSFWWARACSEHAHNSARGILVLKPGASPLAMLRKSMRRADLVITARYVLGFDTCEPIDASLTTSAGTDNAIAAGQDSLGNDAAPGSSDSPSPSINYRYKLRPRPQLEHVAALLSLAQGPELALAPPPEAIASGEQFPPLIASLAAQIKKATPWVTRAKAALAAQDEPAPPLLASLLSAHAELAASADEIAAYLECAAVYAEHKNVGDGPWAYRGVAGLDRAVDELPFTPAGWATPHTNAQITAAATTRRRGIKWTKNKGYPFWPSTTVDIAQAPPALAAQASAQAAQGRVLVRLLGYHPGMSSQEESHYVWVKRLLVRSWGKGAGSSDDPNLHPLLAECPAYAAACKEADGLIEAAAMAAISTPQQPLPAPPVLPAGEGAGTGAGAADTSVPAAPMLAAPNLEGLTAAERLRALLAWKQAQAKAAHAGQGTPAQAAGVGTGTGVLSHASGTLALPPSSSGDDDDAGAISLSGKGGGANGRSGDSSSGGRPMVVHAATAPVTSTGLAAGDSSSGARPTLDHATTAPGTSAAAKHSLQSLPKLAAGSPATGGEKRDDDVIRAKTRDMIAAALDTGVDIISSAPASAVAMDGAGLNVAQAYSTRQLATAQRLLQTTASKIELALHAKHPLASQRKDYATALKALLSLLRNPAEACTWVRLRAITGWLRPFSLLRAAAKDLEKDGAAAVASEAKASAGMKRPMPATTSSSPSEAGGSDPKRARPGGPDAHATATSSPSGILMPGLPMLQGLPSFQGLAPFTSVISGEGEEDGSSEEEESDEGEQGAPGTTTPSYATPALPPVIAAPPSRNVAALLKSLASVVPKAAPPVPAGPGAGGASADASAATAAAAGAAGAADPAVGYEVNPFSADILSASAATGAAGEEAEDGLTFDGITGGTKEGGGGSKRKRGSEQGEKSGKKAKGHGSSSSGTSSSSGSASSGEAGSSVASEPLPGGSDAPVGSTDAEGASLRVPGPAHGTYLDCGKGKDIPASTHLLAVRTVPPPELPPTPPRIPPPVRAPLIPTETRIDGTMRLAKFADHLSNVYHNSGSRAIVVYAVVPDVSADGDAVGTAAGMCKALCLEGRVAVMKASGPSASSVPGLAECFVYLIPPVSMLAQQGKSAEAEQLRGAVASAAAAVASSKVGQAHREAKNTHKMFEVLASEFGYGSIPGGFPPGCAPVAGAGPVMGPVSLASWAGSREWEGLAYAILEYRPSQYGLLQEVSASAASDDSHGGGDFDLPPSASSSNAAPTPPKPAPAHGPPPPGTLLGPDARMGPHGQPVPLDQSVVELMSGTADLAAGKGMAGAVVQLQGAMGGNPQFAFLHPGNKFYPAFLSFVREAALKHGVDPTIVLLNAPAPMMMMGGIGGMGGMGGGGMPPMGPMGGQQQGGGGGPAPYGMPPRPGAMGRAASGGMPQGMGGMQMMMQGGGMGLGGQQQGGMHMGGMPMQPHMGSNMQAGGQGGYMMNQQHQQQQAMGGGGGRGGGMMPPPHMMQGGMGMGMAPPMHQPQAPPLPPPMPGMPSQAGRGMGMGMGGRGGQPPPPLPPLPGMGMGGRGAPLPPLPPRGPPPLMPQMPVPGQPPGYGAPSQPPGAIGRGAARTLPAWMTQQQQHQQQ